LAVNGRDPEARQAHSCLGSTVRPLQERSSSATTPCFLFVYHVCPLDDGADRQVRSQGCVRTIRISERPLSSSRTTHGCPKSRTASRCDVGLNTRAPGARSASSSPVSSVRPWRGN